MFECVQHHVNRPKIMKNLLIALTLIAGFSSVATASGSTSASAGCSPNAKHCICWPDGRCADFGDIGIFP
ncbi:hypothetical protein [Erwinia sp. 9145]|uniref:hypothetical protein n=1 Tax=Erwinia sp. 9145 TaxID=1500895 RepID=UPI0012E0999D|nr:hypothetical protein [Erwinia sp. 9145]